MFDGASFFAEIDFGQAHFGDLAAFGNAYFRNMAVFEGARFEGRAMFDGTNFEKGALLREARSRRELDEFIDIWSEGWTVIPPEDDEAGKIEGLDGVWGYVVPEHDVSESVSATDD